ALLDIADTRARESTTGVEIEIKRRIDPLTARRRHLITRIHRQADVPAHGRVHRHRAEIEARWTRAGHTHPTPRQRNRNIQARTHARRRTRKHLQPPRLPPTPLLRSPLLHIADTRARERTTGVEIEIEGRIDPLATRRRHLI